MEIEYELLPQDLRAFYQFHAREQDRANFPRMMVVAVVLVLIPLLIVVRDVAVDWFPELDVVPFRWLTLDRVLCGYLGAVVGFFGINAIIRAQLASANRRELTGHRLSI